MSATARFLRSQGVLLALALLLLFGAWRYDYFLSPFNILTFLRYNAMFALIALGMCFVIMTGGNRPVGRVDGRHVERRVGLCQPGTACCRGSSLAPAAGLALGVLNGILITRLGILPFIATLVSMLAASSAGLLLAGNQSISVSYDSGFTEIGQGDLFGFPIPAWIALSPMSSDRSS